MFKTAAANTRCLPSNVPKVSYIHSSSRLLHSASEIPSSGHGIETVPQLTSESASTRRPQLPRKHPNATRRDDIDAQPSGSVPVRRTGNSLFHRYKHLLGQGDEDVVPFSRSSIHRHKSANEKKLKSKDKHIKFSSSLGAEKALRPAVQAARVKELAERNELEDAVSLVYAAPPRTLNSIVWNTLLHVLMKAKKRKRAYEVYTEMKRRGFTPDARTYSTMLSGMDTIRVEEWPSNSENIERCHRLYEACESYVQTCKDNDWKSELVSLGHARASYMRVLGKSGHFQRIVDFFYSTDEIGPSARDKFMYATLFNGLMRRKTTEKLGSLNIREQNASDAKFFWRALEKDVGRGMEIDTYVIHPFLKLIGSGRPVDQQFGLEVVRDYFGLSAPGEDAPPPRVQLENYTLHAILELCNKVKKHRLCVYFLKLVMDQQRTNSPNVANVRLDSRHMNEQLIALGQLAAVGSFDESARAIDTIRFLLRSAALEGVSPAQEGATASDLSLHAETVALALAVCWRCGDWEGVTEIFSLVTQFPAEDFLDNGPIAKGYKPPREDRLLYTVAFAHMARTALSTEDKTKMRQFLRMLSTFGAKEDPSEHHLNFYKVQLAKTTVKLVDTVSEDSSESFDSEKKNWQKLKNKSLEVLSKRVMTVRPEREDDVLGSVKYINKLQQAIDFELSAR